MPPVSRCFADLSSAAPTHPSAPAPGHLVGAGEARAVDPQREGPSLPPVLPSPSRVSGVSGSPPGRRGRCRRARAGPERGGARRGASVGAAGAGRRGLGVWRAALRGAGRGSGRAASERAGGEARWRREELEAAIRAPLLYGAARTPRAARRRAPQGTQPAGDGGALPGLGDYPGLHQPPSAAASQGEGQAAEALSRDFVARLPRLRVLSMSRSPCWRLDDALSPLVRPHFSPLKAAS